LKGVRNVPNVSVRSAANVNVYDVAHSEAVVVSKDGAESLEKRLK
jgi:ribosomal protein L4